MENTKQITIGISACLMGHKVRYNGEAKRRNEFLDTLDKTFSLQTLCPEMGIGLGVPRPTIRLVKVGQGTHLRPSEQTDKNAAEDHTAAMRTFARDSHARHPDWCGYIGVKGSPSCGYARIKRFAEDGRLMDNKGTGMFIDELHKTDPLLPIEEDGRLYDAGLRHSFVLRVLTYNRWKSLLTDGLSAAGLIDFYARHKYLVMAHSIPRYQQLGKLLSDAGNQDPTELGNNLIAQLMECFTQPASRKGYGNALYHISGYLKKHLSAAERAEIKEQIDQYRDDIVPLIVPVTLLRSYFGRHPDPYIDQQLFMMPFPAQLGLRNTL